MWQARICITCLQLAVLFQRAKAQQVAQVASPALFASNALSSAAPSTAIAQPSPPQSNTTAVTSQPLTPGFTKLLAETLTAGWNTNVSQQCIQATTVLLTSIFSGAIAADTTPVPGNVVACYNIAAWEPTTGFFAGDVRLYSATPAQSVGNVSLKLNFGKLATLRSFTDSKTPVNTNARRKRQLGALTSALSSFVSGGSTTGKTETGKTASGKQDVATSKSNTASRGGNTATDGKKPGTTTSSTSARNGKTAADAQKPSGQSTTPKPATVPSKKPAPVAPVGVAKQPVTSAAPAQPAKAPAVAPLAGAPAEVAAVAQPAPGLKPIAAQDRSSSNQMVSAPAAILPNEKGTPQRQQAPQQQVISPQTAPENQQPRILQQQQRIEGQIAQSQEVQRFQFLAQIDLAGAAADASGEGLSRALVPGIMLLVYPTETAANPAEPQSIDLSGRTAGFVLGLQVPRGPFSPLTSYYSTYRGFGGRGGSLPGRMLLGLDGSVSLGSIVLAAAWTLIFASSWIFGVINRFDQRQAYRKLRLRL